MAYLYGLYICHRALALGVNGAWSWSWTPALDRLLWYFPEADPGPPRRTVFHPATFFLSQHSALQKNALEGPPMAKVTQKCPKSFSNMLPQRSLLRSLGGVLEPFVALLGASWRLFEAFWRPLGGSWSPLEGLLEPLKGSRNHV